MTVKKIIVLLAAAGFVLAVLAGNWTAAAFAACAWAGWYR